MAKMRLFLRESNVGREPLAVSMSSVRSGERVLQIGVNDPRIVHAIAGKTGITGLATVVVPDESGAHRISDVVGEGSSSPDVRIEPVDRLPFEDGAYDVAVIHNADGLLTSLDASVRNQSIREVLRVLRHGGRVIVLEAGKPTGMRALFGGPKRDAQFETAGGTVAALEAVGFAAVRVLGDREGYRFIEGLKPR